MAIKRITTNLIEDGSIGTIDIANNAIVAAKITNGNITTAKLADLNVTAGKLAGTLDLTGKTITVATATTGDNDTSPASTAFVQQEIAALVDSSPSSLNTLNELAAALGDDASFSTTVTNSIATKLPLAGGTMSGGLNMGSQNISAINNATAVSFLSTNGYWVGGTQRINGSGNLVNIGTISSGAITSSGDIKTTGDVEIASSQPRLHLDRGDGSYSWSIYNGNGSGSFPLSTFNIANNAGTAVITALDNGNVGIGETSPDGELHVKGTGGGNGDIYVERTSGAKIQLQAQSANGKIGTISNHNLGLNTNGTTRITIDTNGDVGIKTSNPDHDLHIESTNPTLILAQSGSLNNTNSGRILFAESPSYTTNNAHFEIKYDGASNHLYFGSPLDQTTDLFVVGRNGKVGIGQTNPTHTLHAPTARLGEEKWLNSVNAYYISSGTINRNLTINLNGSAEYYIIIYIVGIWPYTASAAGTRIVEVTGYGATGNYHSVISNGGAGGQPTSVTVSASGGNLNLAINYNNTYRWNASAKVVYGANGMTMSVDGTNG